MSRTLVIGVGNPLAGDDGVGALVAERLAHRPDVKLVVCHQLTPELAAEVAVADRVVFVDAAREGEGTSVRHLRGSAEISPGDPLTHASSPDAVLALARALYNRAPPAYLVTISGRRFEIGEDLSEQVREQIPEAVRAVQRLLDGSDEAEPPIARGP